MMVESMGFGARKKRDQVLALPWKNLLNGIDLNYLVYPVGSVTASLLQCYWESARECVYGA